MKHENKRERDERILEIVEVAKLLNYFDHS
jgi:hypothetical protein